MKETDSIDALKADILADAPEAVEAACQAKAEEFLVACVRYAKSMQRSGDPWAGLRALTDALILIKEAQRHMDKETAAKQGPKGTMGTFRK